MHMKEKIGKASFLIGVSGLLMIGLATGGLPGLADDSAQKTTENKTDVSHNPITGSTTVTETTNTNVQTPTATRKMKKQLKKKYDRHGKKVEQTESVDATSTHE